MFIGIDISLGVRTAPYLWECRCIYTKISVDVHYTPEYYTLEYNIVLKFGQSE